MKARLQVVLHLVALLVAACAATPAKRSSYGLGDEATFRSKKARTEVWYTLLGEDQSGTPVVLLHPWGTNLLIWRSLATSLSETRPVLLIDLPGHGRSGHPPGRYPPRRLAAAVNDVMIRVGFDRAIVGGNSLGGATAIALAVDHPERVSGLILVGAPGGEAIDALTVRAVSGLTAPHHLQSISHGAMRNLFWFIEGGDSEDGQRVLEEMLVTRSSLEWPLISRAQSSALNEVARFDPPLERIEARALVVHGTSDVVVPLSSGRRLAERLKGAKLVELEGCGHMPELDCPTQLRSEVEAFLNELVSSSLTASSSAP